MSNQDRKPIDLSLLERVNPIYNTAKMSLCGLAMSGDRDAAAISEKLGLPSEMFQVSASDPDSSSPNQLAALQAQANAVFLEIRFRTTWALAENSGCRTIVDLPCGYTPRGLQAARANRSYIGLDLPATISEAEHVIMPMVDEDKRPLIRYAAVDATNYESLESALEGADGPICVTTEGLVMYFNDSEAAQLCGNIHRLLSRYGGCWITSDPEMMIQNTEVMRAIAGDRFQEVINNSMKAFEDKADIHVEVPALVILPWKDVAADTKKVLSFLSGQGLKAKRMTVGRHMPEISSLSTLKPEAAEAVKKGMETCAYWKIELAEDTKPAEEEHSASGFTVRAAQKESRLDLCLSGRLDTLTAPKVLELFEKISRDTAISNVFVDCSKLQYISSAGLRVLLIMHKACKDGVTLRNTDEVITEILNQTGFDRILHF